MTIYMYGDCPVCGEEDCQKQKEEIEELIKRMGKTLIGPCGDCKHWTRYDFCRLRDQHNWAKDDGCNRWKEKDSEDANSIKKISP